MNLHVLENTFAVAKVEPNVDFTAWAHAGELIQIVRTPNELSIVCRDDAIPPGITAERGWRCFASNEPLDLNQVGILSSISVPLSEASISIFVISTFDNDFVLVRSRDLVRAITVLEAAGFHFTHQRV